MGTALPTLTIGIFALQNHKPELAVQTPCQVYNLVLPGKGGFSGGTIESGMTQYALESPDTMRRLNTDPYFLVPQGTVRMTSFWFVVHCVSVPSNAA